MDHAALVMNDVACVRGGRLVFDGLSLTLGPGQAAVLTGPNGVGKSSLIRMAAGLIPPADGTVTVEGHCALMAEASALDADRPLAEALRFWSVMDGARDTRRRTGDAIHAMGLAELAAVPVRLLSTGQRRRAAFARVLASGAPIWLLDEPANGMDAASVDRMVALIAAHRAAGGIALIATHQPLDIPGARAMTIGVAA